MGKWKCVNKECENFDVYVEVMDLNWPYELQSKRIKDSTCKLCNERMKPKPFESSKQAPAHLKFNSLSDTDKKKVLKKRAADEYKKSGGVEQKLLKQREAISKMKGK